MPGCHQPQTTARMWRDVQPQQLPLCSGAAYSALVTKRVAELGEERAINYQRIGIFLDRRFSPHDHLFCRGRAHCRSSTTQERPATCSAPALTCAGRPEPAVAALHEARTRQQLMLQETVEGISVVAISYYLFNIVAIFANGAAKHFFGEGVRFPRLGSRARHIPVVSGGASGGSNGASGNPIRKFKQRPGHRRRW